MRHSLICELEDKQATFEYAQEEARRVSELQEKPKRKGLDSIIHSAEEKRKAGGTEERKPLRKSYEEER